MNINRNNYEEFLLLYVDGELNSSEKKVVEEFLQINSDLQKELDTLLSTKLTPEDVALTDKSFLYKSDTNSISLKNYEEKFLLYTDNELTEVEKFVLQHPTLQQEFISIKSSILEKENIKHPNKESLYKKERKPIFFIGFKQIAVAAALLLFIIALWIFNFNSNNINKNSVTKENNHQLKENNLTTITKNEKEPSKQLVTTNKTTQKDKIKLQKHQNNTSNQLNNISSLAINNQSSTTDFTKKENEIVSIETTNEKSINEISQYKPFINQNIEMPAAIASSTNNSKTINEKINYKYLDEDNFLDEETDTNTINEAVVYIGNMQVKKSKVKNILSKTKAFFSKNKSNPINKALANIL